MTPFALPCEIQVGTAQDGRDKPSVYALEWVSGGLLIADYTVGRHDIELVLTHYRVITWEQLSAEGFWATMLEDRANYLNHQAWIAENPTRKARGRA